MDYKKLSKICDGEVTRLDSSLVSKWNEYCENANYTDDMIYSMDEFDEMMNGQSPSDIARSIWYGSFNPNADWFWFDGRGNLCAGDYTNENDCPVDLDAIEEEPEEDEEIEEEEIEEEPVEEEPVEE